MDDLLGRRAAPSYVRALWPSGRGRRLEDLVEVALLARMKRARPRTPSRPRRAPAGRRRARSSSRKKVPHRPRSHGSLSRQARPLVLSRGCAIRDLRGAVLPGALLDPFDDRRADAAAERVRVDVARRRTPAVAAPRTIRRRPTSVASSSRTSRSRSTPGGATSAGRPRRSSSSGSTENARSNALQQLGDGVRVLERRAARNVEAVTRGRARRARPPGARDRGSRASAAGRRAPPSRFDPNAREPERRRRARRRGTTRGRPRGRGRRCGRRRFAGRTSPSGANAGCWETDVGRDDPLVHGNADRELSEASR